MDLPFIPRSELSDFEWDSGKQHWQRLKIEREELTRLSQRSNLHGIVRVAGLAGALTGLALATLAAARIHLLLAIPVLYLYYFLYGFLVALAHELQHKIVFAKSLDRLSECVYFIVQVLLWNGPRYARISHRLHHRYTMVEGIDPETDWPRVITSKWLKTYLRDLILNILFLGAFRAVFRDARTLLRRAAGKKDRMMQNHCSVRDIRKIRIESGAILAVHVLIVLSAITFQRWWPLFFITLAWQVGSSIEALWHQTEHISRLRDVNDQRLCTRSVKVNPLIRLIYGGLDDHVDHHIFPGVPSRNLPKLHNILYQNLPEPRTMIGCWREMFAIAREKDQHPDHEYVPIDLT